MTSIPDEMWTKIAETSGHLECPVCHRLLRDHTREESLEHLKEDVKIELDIAPIRRPPELNYAYGPVVLSHAIGYLEATYGAQEAPAVELLREKTGGDLGKEE